MIIEKTLTANDTISIKTNAGEEIVARFIEEDVTTITVQKPMVLMQTQSGIGLGPLTFTVSPDAKLKLNKASILFSAKTDGEMAKQYISSTSSIQMV
jgi:hypothetical protein